MFLIVVFGEPAQLCCNDCASALRQQGAGHALTAWKGVMARLVAQMLTWAARQLRPLNCSLERCDGEASGTDAYVGSQTAAATAPSADSEAGQERLSCQHTPGQDRTGDLQRVRLTS